MESIRISHLFAAFCLGIVNAASSELSKPHIITILIDDLGWNDVGFHGSNQISTPNIDALAYSGIILNRHYVLPTCTPSRASLLTGSYPIRTGMQGFPMKCGTRRGIPLSVKLKPAYLKSLGYHTHLVGKWHLGYHSPEYTPNRRGFDSFFGYYNGYIEYFDYGVEQGFKLNNESYKYYGYDLHRDSDQDWKWKGKYATHVFTDRVKKIIQNQNKSEPLYLLMSHLGVHTGVAEGSGLEVPSDMNVNALYGYIKDHPRRELAGLLEEVDKSVGAIVVALQENGMLDNSVILIMSDNGGHTVSTDMQPNWSSSWPLRGVSLNNALSIRLVRMLNPLPELSTKFTMYEGGVRGAALIWSPLLPKGVISEQFIHISDWLPTFYSAAGGNLSDLKDIDGINQWNALKEMSTQERDHILLNIDEVEGHEGIILKNRWKLTKGGLKKYGNYDYHWGREENIAPNPSDYYLKVWRSTAGRVLQNFSGYEDNFKTIRMKHLRQSSQIKCGLSEDPPNIRTGEGYVDESLDFFCSDYCIFDIINDPCELKKIQNEKIFKKGFKLLQKYKRNLRPQEDNSVDPLSDPAKFGGAWVPWLQKTKLFYK